MSPSMRCACARCPPLETIHKTFGLAPKLGKLVCSVFLTLRMGSDMMRSAYQREQDTIVGGSGQYAASRAGCQRIHRRRCFFVLSGYLITSHLLREVATTGSVSLGGFWARRIRRLMPASFLVLAASLVAAVAVLPQPLWAQTLAEIRAATLYIENWVLASNSVDYLAAENAPNVVQHFWSLSVEEPFYVVWPILLLSAVWLASRVGISRLASMRYVLFGIVAVSLPLGVVLSYTLPGPAYFITPTRVWEFAAGGLLATAPGLAARLTGPVARAGVSWLGVGLILTAAVSFSSST